MSIYAYANPYNSIGQITNDIVPFGNLAGEKIEEIFTAPEIMRKSDGKLLVSQTSGVKEIDELVQPKDVLITTSLTNFSIDFISALQIVEELDNKNVRVIAYYEDFDTSKMMERVLLAALPMMHKFRRIAFEAKRNNRMAGIEKAAAEGKYKGRQSYTINDFPEFAELYRKYMFREIGKGEFAKQLNVSRPTLEKLLDEFTEKGGR